MKLASSLHNSAVRIPFTFDFNLHRTSPISCPKNARVQFSLRRSYPLYSGVCDCGRKYYYYSTISCARKTEQEQESSALEGKTSTSPSHDGVDGVDSSENISSISNSEEKDAKTVDYASSLRTVALCVFSAVAFGVGLGFKDGVGKASEFFAGYLLEQSLSVDNLFVFVLIFKYFKVPLQYQNQVLSYGIAGAIIFRLTLILLGTVTLQRFEAVNLLLAAILLYSSFKLFAEEDEDSDLSDNFIVKTCQKFIPVTSNYDGNRFITVQNDVWKATPLLLTVAVIELSDIAFAVDSIPAVFGVTRDPFIVCPSNLFAILGLRSYYTLISESMADLEYLQIRTTQTDYCPLYIPPFPANLDAPKGWLSLRRSSPVKPAIGGILGFIGCKMILDFFGFHLSTEVSLGFVATSLSAGVLLSLMKKSD